MGIGDRFIQAKPSDSGAVSHPSVFILCICQDQADFLRASSFFKNNGFLVNEEVGMSVKTNGLHIDSNLCVAARTNSFYTTSKQRVVKN